MESQLQAYRRKKRREKLYEGFKSKVFSMLPFISSNKEAEKQDQIIDIADEKEDENDQCAELDERPLLQRILEEADSTHTETDSITSDATDAGVAIEEDQSYKFVLRIVYFLFWVTCYTIAIELQFGIVFLMFSALLGIYLNTRTGPKPKNEISAYSVFNKNCESIDGTLKAEQFEREIRYGPSAVK